MSLEHIVAEFSYWLYGQFSKTAMVRRPEVSDFDVQKIAEKYAVKVQTRRTSSSYFSPGRLPSRYPKVTITVLGENPNEVRGFTREIILLYGRPDEIPLALSPKKRAGRAIVEAMLREYPGR
jgi:hypothetical protein